MFVRLVLLALLVALAPAQQKSTSLFQEVDEMTTSLSQITGWPVITMVRGQVVVRDGELVGARGHGAYLARNRSALAAPDLSRA